jgi:hypothetical protein
MPKKKAKRTTIAFTVSVFPWAHGAETKGTVVLLDDHGIQAYGKAGKMPFNNLDEIPKTIRLLIRDVRKLKRKYDRGSHWIFVPKS